MNPLAMIAELRTHLNRWSAPAGRSVNERILAAALTVGALTLLVKLAGAVKVMVMANHFGTGDEMDAFLIAFLLPSFVAEVLAASFSAALIPTFVEIREQEGRAKAVELLSGVTSWTLRLLLVVTIALALCSHWIVALLGSGFSEAKLEQAQALFLALLPLLVLSGVSATWRAVLNAGEKFALAAIAPGMTPLLTIALLVAFDVRWGAYTLVLGAVVGTLLEVALVGHTLRQQGYPLLPRWSAANARLRLVGEQYAPLLASALITGGSVLVDQAMAARLGSGSVSVLNYGIKIVTVVLMVGTTALSTAVLPHFSRMTAQRDWSGVRATLGAYLRGVLAVSVPLILLLIYFAEPIVRLLLERGAFTEADTSMVAAVQANSLLQVPICLAGVLIVRVISALKSNSLLLHGAILNMLINVSLNLIFMRWWGVAGIALSTTIAHLISYSYLFLRLRKLQRS
jgi:putative peptidoglycan lipid II flippase